VLTHEGGATLIVRGDDSAIRHLERALRDGGARIVQHARPAGPPARAALTPGQEEALAAAIDHGYYEVPRRITLRELASVLGVKPSALSERLRRAEANVILRYQRDAGAPGSPNL
jgi:predicted DNA binding protein